jgi:copper chaperone CopZ
MRSLSHLPILSCLQWTAWKERPTIDWLLFRRTVFPGRLKLGSLPQVFLFSSLALPGSIAAEEVERSYQITSFFIPERADAIRKDIETSHEGIKVVKLDFAKSTVTLRFDPEVVVPRAGKNTQSQDNLLNQLIRSHTQGLITLAEPISREDLAEVTIPVAGLDCIGCSYAAYEAVRRVEGVEYAIASFKEGKVYCRFDDAKTNPRELQEALLKKQIPLNYSLAEPGLVPPNEMSIIRFSTEEPGSLGYAKHAIDGNPQTKWESHWHGGQVDEPPHELVIDLGKTREVTGFRYLARQLGSVGVFANTEFYVSNSFENFGKTPAAKTTFTDVKTVQSVNCEKPHQGRYVLVRMLSEINGKPNGTAAEIGIIADHP